MPGIVSDRLRLDDAIEIDVVSQFALFDGRKTHEVEVTTQGIRYSIIFYCSSGYEGASTSDTDMLIQLGFVWPTDDLIANLISMTGRTNVKRKFHQPEETTAIHQDRQPEQPTAVHQESHLAPMPEAATDIVSLEFRNFRNHSLNQKFIVHPQVKVNGEPTFFNRDGSMFVYKAGDGLLRICPAQQGEHDMVHAAQQGETFGTAYQKGDSAGWREHHHCSDWPWSTHLA